MSHVRSFPLYDFFAPHGRPISARDISITIRDDHFFQKTYKIHPQFHIICALDQFSAHVCTKCSDKNMLTFWFGAIELNRSHTAALLDIQHGDIIDVRITDTCTRGSCPLPKEQSAPNLHYLSNSNFSLLREDLYPPPPPTRLNLNFKDVNGFTMAFCVRENAPLLPAMQAFAAKVGRDVKTECRFLFEGERTPVEKGHLGAKDWELEDGDTIEVHWFAHGGGT